LKFYAYIYIVFLLFSAVNLAQQNAISMKVELDDKNDLLKIQQEIIYNNTSDSTFSTIYLHNWANSYSNRKTPLFKRFVENFRKDLYFAKEKDLGYSKIENLSVNFENADFKELENQADIIQVKLKNPLLPKKSIKITITYVVKIPSNRFTNYGKNDRGYHLRYWYITPAVYKEGWQLMSNLNIDDLFECNKDFNIEIDVPKNYVVESNLYQYKTDLDDKINYYLIGKNKVDILLSINTFKQQEVFVTDKVNVYSNVNPNAIDHKLATSILNRELLFIEKYLGKYPHLELYIDKATQRKNPIYGLNQLPNFLRPFSDTFKWDVTMFKALSQKYIENTLLVNKRKDYWLVDGLQNYLMIEYVETFKYPFLYQFVARKFIDQSLTTSSDSLSNFNRKVISKYKSGLGFKFLQGYLGDSILNKSIKELYQNNTLKIVSSETFRKEISSKTSKKLDWFFGDYLKTNKKIDHKIDYVKQENDSLLVTISNKRNMVTPVALYALKDGNIKAKKWISNIDSVKTVSIKKGDYDFVVLNYENLYPELNTLNNWYKIDKKIFNKPVKFSFLKDVSNPNFNQLVFQPNTINILKKQKSIKWSMVFLVEH